MAYVITDLCTKCMSCPDVCPVSCIHPEEGQAGLEGVAHLNIDPDQCIDCGVCAEQCPAEAIFADTDIPADKQQFVRENADYFSR